MAMGPRMDPFPWETYFIDARVLTAQQQINALNNSQNDGVQFNVNLIGYAGSWEHPYTSYAPGLLFPPENDTFYATRVPSIPFGDIYQYTPTQWLPSGIELSLWVSELAYIGDTSIRLASHPENVDPVLKQRYTSPDMRYGVPNGTVKGPIPTAGLHTYPGVYGVVGRDIMEPVWCNAPVGIECWFSENPNRTDPSIGYSGYTAFGDQGSAYFQTGQIEEVTDAYIRRIVVGMVRTAADPTNLSVTDMMCGVIVTYDGTDTVVRACANGTVLWSASYNQAFQPSEMDFWWESAWSGDATLPRTHWTGQMDNFDLYIIKNPGAPFPTDRDYRYISTYDNTILDPEALYIDSYDSYDIKYVMYMDAYSPSYPVNQPVPRPSAPTTPVQLYFDSTNMYTNHYWTVPLTYRNVASNITGDISSVSVAQPPTNNYVVDTSSVTTPNVSITNTGELVLAGSVGTNGDVVMSPMQGEPAVWNGTIREYHTTLDALVSRINIAENGGG